VEAERDLLTLEIDWAGMCVYLATPTMALAKAGAMIYDVEIEAVMDVVVAKDCTAEMVVAIVEEQTTGEMNALRLKGNIPILAC
jgi:hypothetical protein